MKKITLFLIAFLLFSTMIKAQSFTHIPYFGSEKVDLGENPTVSSKSPYGNSKWVLITAVFPQNGSGEVTLGLPADVSVKSYSVGEKFATGSIEIGGFTFDAKGKIKFGVWAESGYINVTRVEDGKISGEYEGSMLWPATGETLKYKGKFSNIKIK